MISPTTSINGTSGKNKMTMTHDPQLAIPIPVAATASLFEIILNDPQSGHRFSFFLLIRKCYLNYVFLASN